MAGQLNTTRLCCYITLLCAVAAETGMHQLVKISVLPGLMAVFYPGYKRNFQQYQVFAMQKVFQSTRSSRRPPRIAA